MMTLKTKATGEVEPAGAGPASGASAQNQSRSHAPANDGLPLLGMFAVGFGVLGIFTFAPLFVPLALIFGLIALFAGQLVWGFSAVVLAVAGFLSSPIFMTLLGMGAVAAWIGDLF